MVQFFKSLSLALLLSAGAVTVGQAASFDCTKATTETEIAICNDPELSALDEILGELWTRTSQSSSVVADQVLWLKERDANIQKMAGLVSNRVLDTHWEITRYLREFYERRIVRLVTGCIPDDNLFEIFDDEFTLEEFDKLIESSNRLERCIDEHYQSIAKDFEAISYTLSVLPEGCVIGFDPFMYPISERSGHYIVSRCGTKIISRYLILLDSILELIKEKNKGIPASLANDQIIWEAFYKGSCKFYDTPQFENSYTGNVGAQEQCVSDILKFRVLYLSPWIGVDSAFGWPASSISEVLGDEYGRYIQ